jgi:hypothetical protein
VRHPGVGLGVLAGGGAVEDRRPGHAVCADLGLGVVVGAPVGGVMPDLDLVHAVDSPQIDLQVMQAARGISILTGCACPAVGPGVPVDGHVRVVQGHVAGCRSAGSQVLIGVQAAHALAVAVVDEAGRHCAAGAGQAVLLVVGQVGGIRPDDALGHIAVGIVPVLLHPAQVRDGVLVGSIHVSVCAHPGLAGQVAGRSVVGVALSGVGPAGSAAGGNGTTKMLLRYRNFVKDPNQLVRMIAKMY